MFRPHGLLAIIPLFLLGFCDQSEPPATADTPPLDAAFVRLSPLEAAALPVAVRFDAPMGTEAGAFTYNAQPFRVTRHLGDDLNGIGGWNSDLGDAIYASSTGTVVYAGWPSDGWGNMVYLAHRMPDETAPGGQKVLITVYAHLDKVLVKYGDLVPRGTKLGTAGTAGGKYLAHLHFEVRDSHSIYPGPGYSDAALDRMSPGSLIRARGVPGEMAPLGPPEKVR